jgi:hypothetical protein
MLRLSWVEPMIATGIPPRATRVGHGLADVTGYPRVVGCLLAVLACLGPRTAGAVDVYSFFDESCNRQSGILAHVDDVRVLIVDLEGTARSLPRSSVRSLVLHQVLENPLPQVDPQPMLRQLMRRVWTDETAEPSFEGWIAGFHDDLLIFFDTQGKTHVVQSDEIVRLRSFTSSTPIRVSGRRAPWLGYPRTVVPCSAEELEYDQTTVMPSRVIADRIKLDDLLTALAESYRDFASLEERTHVYAQPFHLEPTLRLGLTYIQGSGWAQYFPFYFLWSAGKPHRFQSRLLIGTATHDALPFVRPTLSAASDVKSHFFHATLVVQLPALPAESNAFLVDHGELKMKTVTPSFNYLILMGVDYWRLSASFGPAYLSFRLGDLNDGLTIPATSVSYVFRLQYRATTWRARALYYLTRLSGALGGRDLTLGYEAKSDTIRLGVAAKLPWRIGVSLDQILTFGSLAPTPGQDVASTADFEVNHFRAETALMIGAEFGRYIAVKAHVRFLFRRYQQPDGPVEDLFEPLFGGVLEFVF